MNLPTKLTFLRILLIPVFITLYFVQFPFHFIAATAVFLLASFTDFLDGYIARKYNLVTDLGKFLDPIADKLLVACALFAILSIANPFIIATTICCMIIICRELMVSGFRIVASSKNIVMAADIFGKIKTVLQMVALILLLPCSDFLGNSNAAMSLVGDILLYSGLIVLALSTIMAVASAVNYLVKNKQVLKG